MSTVEKSIEVELPVTTVYNQWTQFEEFPRFMAGVESVTQLDDTRLLGFVSKQAEGDLKRFKEFIEERGRETGGWRGQVSV